MYQKNRNAKIKFFRGAIKAKTKSTLYKGKRVDKMPIKDVLKVLDTLFTERNDKVICFEGTMASILKIQIFTSKQLMSVVGHNEKLQ